MIVSIHQPNFIPYLGFFHKWKNCDTFVFLDDAQFPRNGFMNRNRLTSKGTLRWVTIPVLQKGRFGQSINKTEVVPDNRWRRKMIGTIRECYSKSKYTSDLMKKFEPLINQEGLNLAEINISILKWLAEELDIKVPTVRSSRMGLNGYHSTERLIEICEKLNADVYLSGVSGGNYQDEAAFIDHGIEVTVSDFKHPEYKQAWPGFIPNPSVLDLVFNHGPHSKEILWGDEI